MQLVFKFIGLLVIGLVLFSFFEIKVDKLKMFFLVVEGKSFLIDVFFQFFRRKIDIEIKKKILFFFVDIRCCYSDFVFVLILVNEELVREDFKKCGFNLFNKKGIVFIL